MSKILYIKFKNKATSYIWTFIDTNLIKKIPKELLYMEKKMKFYSKKVNQIWSYPITIFQTWNWIFFSIFRHKINWIIPFFHFVLMGSLIFYILSKSLFANLKIIVLINAIYSRCLPIYIENSSFAWLSKLVKFWMKFW